VQARGLLLAGLVAFLPFGVHLATGGSVFIADAAWTGLALFPWLALAGAPRGAASRAEPRGSWLLPVALALPAVGLGIASDTRIDARILVLALGGLGLIALWTLCARRARGATAYGLAWFVLVPLPPALVWALAWAPGGGRESWLENLELGLPLPWLARGMELGVEPETGRLLIGLAGNLALALVLLGLTTRRAEGPA